MICENRIVRTLTNPTISMEIITISYLFEGYKHSFSCIKQISVSQLGTSLNRDRMLSSISNGVKIATQ